MQYSPTPTAHNSHTMTLQTSPAPTSAPAPARSIPAPPEPGQVVQVRGAVWAVTNVAVQGLPRSSADDGEPRLEHVVDLQSLDEDRVGEELTVIWELEVGNAVVPDRGLPETIAADAFDDPETLGAFVDAVRWGAVTSAGPKAFRRPSAPAPPWSPTSSSPCAEHSRPHVPTSCWPTMSAWARPSRRAWSSRSCCCVTGRARSSSCARRVSP